MRRIVLCIMLLTIACSTAMQAKREKEPADIYVNHP